LLILNEIPKDKSQIPIGACYLIFGSFQLSLALLEAGILFVNNIQLALATNNLTICAALFN
jgi:hypothetical protein